jgi:hypothetical protein
MLTPSSSTVPAVPPKPASKATTATVTVASKATTATATVYYFAPARTPKWDPVLAPGDWGIISLSTAGVPESTRTSKLHRDVRQHEINKLTAKQAKSLLSIFKCSDEVQSLVEANGGDLDQTAYKVVKILADAETGVNTPWVTATLRATYPAHGGLKGLEVDVFRQKTSKGLSNAPYVTSTRVGYISDADTIVNPKSLTFSD